MYFFCYARSERARETARRILDILPGEMLRSIEMSGPLLDDGIVVLIMPLEAAIKMIRSGKLFSRVKYPILLMSSDGRNVSAFYSDEISYEAGELLRKELGVHNNISLSDRQDFIPDLDEIVKKYEMKVSSERALSEIRDRISEGERVRVFTELNVKTCGDGISDEIFDIYRFPLDKRNELIRAYEICASRGETAIFITCTKIPATADIPVLTPRLLTLGLEISSKSDSEYAGEGVIDTLRRLRISPDAISRTATSDNVAKLNSTFNIVSSRVGIEALSFESSYLRGLQLPDDDSGFIRTVDLCSAAAYAAAGGEGAGLMYRRIDTRTGILLSISIPEAEIVI